MNRIFFTILFLCLCFYIILLFLSFFGQRYVSQKRWTYLRRFLQITTIFYPVSLLTLLIFNSILKPKEGILVLIEIFTPYLFIPVLCLIPISLIKRNYLLRVILCLCLITFLIRYTPNYHYSQHRSNIDAISIISWNLGIGSEKEQQLRLRPLLIQKSADIVVLQEAYWRWLEADEEVRNLYPHQLSRFGNAEKGLVILSSFPILNHTIPDQNNEQSGWHRIIQADIDIGQSQSLHLIALHALPPSLKRGCTLLCFQTKERNELLSSLLSSPSIVNPAKQPVLLVGDFNLSNYEYMYSQLSHYVQDFHDAVGTGYGHTWPIYSPTIPQSSFIKYIGPLIRIDHIFGNANILPISFNTDCRQHGSDHCLIRGVFTIY